MYRLEIRRLIRALLKHRDWILLMTLSASVNAVIITYVISEKYDATALVLVRPREEVRIAPSQDKEEVLDFPVPTGVPLEAMARTYSEVIKSRAVIERVVTSLRMDLPPTDLSWWERLKNGVKGFLGNVWSVLKYGRLGVDSPLEEAVELVQKSLVVAPTQDTYVFQITYRAKSPDQAASVANRAAEVFLEYNGELNRRQATVLREFLEEQLEESRRALGQARETLRRFKERDETVAFGTEVGTEISVRSGLETDLEAVEKDIKGLEAEIDTLSDQLAGQERFLMSESTVAENPVVGRLKGDIAAYEVDLSALLQTLTPAHPDAVALQAKIDEARSKLRTEEARVVSEETSSLNAVHQGLLSELLLAEARLTGLRAKERQLVSSIEDRRGRLREFPEKERQMTELDLAVTTAEESYEFLVRTHGDAKLKEAERAAEIELVAPAVPPANPVKPIKIYYAAAAAVLALSIGIGLSLAMDYFDVRIRSIGAAEELLGVPVLATVPTMEPASEPLASFGRDR